MDNTFSYEKKYNEALGWMRSVYPTLTGATKEDAEHYFPELRESEDERIRKAIIELLKEIGRDDTGISENAKCMIAYLEKQKEQKPVKRVEINKSLTEAVLAELSKYNGENYYKSPWAIDSTGLQYPLYFANLGATWQKEQKPAEWSEDYREEDIQTRFAFYTYKDDPSVLYLSNVFVEDASRNHGFGTRILKAAEKAAEAMGAITIRIKVKQDSPANAWYRKRGYGYVAFEDGYDWLEKNLEYLKPAKSAEWSEEDEDRIRQIERIAQQAGCTQKLQEEIHDWLKDLRPTTKK